MTHYKTIINKRIKDGSLPKAYKLGDIEIPKADPDYQTILVPKGLTLDQWDTLLKKTCNGLWHSSEWEDFTGKGWETMQVYVGQKPLETNIKYDEEYNHCSAQEYLALQWYLLETAQQPVDKDTWSFLGREGFTDSGSVPAGDWLPGRGQVYLDWAYADYFRGNFGVRPSGRGRALELDTSLEPLASSSEAPLSSKTVELDIEEILVSGEANTKALNRLSDLLEKIFKVEP